MKKVTIVIPNYNGEHYIKDCLNALKEQTCKGFKVIVVDNGSEDGSIAVLEKEKQGLCVELVELDHNY